jgi:hypothetical protein
VRRFVILGLVIGAVACGQGADVAFQTRSGPTAFEARSGVFRTNTASLNDAPVQILALYLLDVPLWCSPTNAGTPPETLTGIAIEVAKFGSEAVGPGIYSIRTADGAPIEGAIALYYTVEPDGPGDTLDAAGGTLRLSTVTSVSAVGEADLTLEDGTVLSGSFSAITCRQ